MNIRLVTAICLTLACLLVATPAAEAKGKGNKKSKIPTSILEKYDTNKDGKLSKKERASMTPEDAALVPAKKNKKKA
jgi:hypothetical protein